ncbi:MAG: biotin transporter BioY [Treponemataceae bacterium]
MKTKLTLTNNSIRSFALFVAAFVMAISGMASFKIGDLKFYFTFQNMFAIFFAALFGGIQGASVSGIVLISGALGLPVFSHFGKGMEVLSGPTGGFLIGYFVGALLTGFVIGKPENQNDPDEKIPFSKIFSGCLAGFFMIEFLGIIKFFQFNSIKIDLEVIKILGALKFKYYIIADIIKLIIASICAYYLRPICSKYFYEK